MGSAVLINGTWYYTETEDGPVIFELLMLIEGLLIEHGILLPHTGQYLMRRKAEPLMDAAGDTAEPLPVIAEPIR